MQGIKEKINKKKTIIITGAVILTIAVVFFAGIIIAKNIFPLEHKERIIGESQKYDIDPYLVMAVIRTESNFNELAESHAGAVGLMQIMEGTGAVIAENLGKDNYSKDLLKNADINIEFGTWYINWLLDKYDNDLKNALAAYNAGFNNVDKWLEDKNYSADGKTLNSMPYKETENFVNRVMLYRSIYNILY